MTKYSIEQFSRITNIPKINLRTWENRYSYLIPERTDSNIRIYCDKLLVKGIKTKLLLESGYKISHVTKMSDDELKLSFNSIELDNNHSNKINYYISGLIISAINFDEYKFNILFEKGLKEFDFIEFYKSIILPLLRKIGVLWLINEMSPSQEHFLSELIKQKISSLIDQVPHAPSTKEKWVLFLPENEFHEIGLLFAKYILVSKNYHVIYLGDNVPIDTLSGVADKHKIDNVLIFLLANTSISMSESHLKKCLKIFPSSKIFVVTPEKKSNFVKLNPSQISVCNDIDSFIDLLENK